MIVELGLVTIGVHTTITILMLQLRLVAVASADFGWNPLLITLYQFHRIANPILLKIICVGYKVFRPGAFREISILSVSTAQ